MPTFQVQAKGMQEASQQLREYLMQASNGDEIVIAAGTECLGPFVIDKQIKIIGGGPDATMHTLFASQSPVLIITSPGVTIRNISVHYAGRGDGVAILAMPGTDPNLVNLDIMGAQDIIRSDQLLDLGTLTLAPSTIPLEVDTIDAATLSLNLAGGSVTPSQLPAAGAYIVNMALDPDAALAGQTLFGSLALKMGSQEELIWLKAEVESAVRPGTIGKTIQLSASNGHILSSSSQITIGPVELQSVLGMGNLSQHIGVIAREANDVWAFYRIWKTNTPVTLNGRQLPKQGRVVLNRGDRLSIAGTDLSVDTAAIQTPVIEPRTIHFGDAQAGTPVIAQFQLVNQGHQAWQGQAETTGNGLQALTPVVNCPANQRTTLELQLDLPMTPDASVRLTNAVILRNAQYSIFANIDFQAAGQVRLSVTPEQTLNFGRVSSWQAVTGEFTIRNDGTQPITGLITAIPAWLKLGTDQFTLAPGTSQQVMVQLTDQFENLPPGPVVESAAISIQGDNATLYTLGVKVQRGDQGSSQRIHAVLKTQGSISFNQVRSSSQTLPTTIQIVNTGVAAWQGNIVSNVPWLSVEPTQCRIEPNDSLAITAKLLPSFDQLSLGRQDVDAGIELVNAQGVALRVPISASRVADPVTSNPNPISSSTLEFGKVQGWQTTPSKTVVIRNTGGQAWHYSLTKVPWLNTSSEQGTIEQGQDHAITVTLNQQVASLPANQWLEYPHALRLSDGKINLDIYARLFFVSTTTSQAQVTVDQTHVNFKSATQWEQPPQLRSVKNTSNLPWYGKVKTADWLDVSPQQIRCSPNASIDLLIRPKPGMATQLRSSYSGAVIVCDNADVEIARIPVSFHYKSGDSVSSVFQSATKPTAPTGTTTPSQQPSSPSLSPVFGQSTPVPPSTPSAPRQTAQPSAAQSANLQISPTQLNFGFSKTWRPGLSRSFEVRNTSQDVWEGTIKTSVPWLKVAFASVTCHPGQVLSVSVKLGDTPPPDADTVTLGNAITLQSQDEVYTIGVTIQLDAPSPDSSILSDVFRK